MNTKISAIIASITIAAIVVLFTSAPLLANNTFAYRFFYYPHYHYYYPHKHYWGHPWSHRIR
ncbi:MAG: hypothetical protein WA364_16085 [Candidatus Nitrosopolaris sp.]